MLYVFWLLTRDEAIVITGICLIPPFVVMVIMAFIGLNSTAKRFKEEKTPGARPKILMAAGIILLNIPVSLAIAQSVSDIYSLYSISIVNDTDHPISDIVITDPAGQKNKLPPVQPQDQSRYELELNGEGSVTYSLKTSSGPQKGTLLGYITTGMQDLTPEIKINPDGTVSVDEDTIPVMDGPF